MPSQEKYNGKFEAVAPPGAEDVALKVSPRLIAPL